MERPRLEPKDGETYYLELTLESGALVVSQWDIGPVFPPPTADSLRVHVEVPNVIKDEEGTLYTLAKIISARIVKRTEITVCRYTTFK